MIEGEILQVMESWPLELVVQIGRTKRSLSLTDQTIVLDREKTSEPGRIKPGQKVRLTIAEDSENIVTEIQIID